MKRSHKIVAGLILAGTLSGVALAQGWGGCEGKGPMGRHAAMKFDPAERAEQRLDYLKYQLKITAAQEPLWNAYAGKLKAQAGKGMQAMRDQADARLAAPERMAKMQAVMEEHLAAMKDVHESFGRLYAALTPEQQQLADSYVARMGKGGMQRGPARGAGPQG